VVAREDRKSMRGEPSGAPRRFFHLAKAELGQFVQGLADAAFPRRCAACRGLLPAGTVAALCAECELSLTAVEHPMCPRCGLPYVGCAGPDHDCPGCTLSPPPFEKALSAFLYGGSAHDMITAMKYSRRMSAGAELFRLASAACDLASFAAGCDLVVPVPTALGRLVVRGFNQAELIAGMVSAATGITHDPTVLKRVFHSRPQVGLGRSDRAMNLRGVFAVRRGRLVRGKRLLLVDDVMTTGATARECSRVLLDAGAASVRVFTLARTI